MDTPGVKLICRHSYEMAAAATGSPFDYPLSSRMDENDAILIFDNALIPWEDVLHYGDVERADHFLLGARMSGRVSIQAFTRLVVKLEFLIGLVAKATHLAGTSDFTTVHTLIGELVMWRNTVRGLLDAMVEVPDVLSGEYLTFNETYAMTLRGLGPTIYTRMRDIVQKACGSSLIYLNSHASDFKSEDMRPYLDRYLRGSKGVDAMRRSKVMKLLWDSIGSEFGARHELYERHYLGGHDAVLQGPLYLARAAGDMKKFEELAEQCMSEYNIDGWTLPGFQNNEDISVTGRSWD
jgi:4-hydroxyphenylacetate 3-monooxygenase